MEIIFCTNLTIYACLLDTYTFLARSSSSLFRVRAIKQIVQIVRDTIQHTAGRAVAATRCHHDLRGLLLAVGLLTLARIGDIRDDARHVLSVLQLRVRSRRQLDVALDGQRDVRHRAQSRRLHVSATENLGRGTFRGHARHRQEDLPVAASVLVEEAATVVDAAGTVGHHVRDAARTARGEVRVDEHVRRRFLILARTRAVVLQIDVVRMVHPDLRQESAGHGNGDGFRVSGRRFGIHELAHIYAANGDASHLPVRNLADDRGGCWRNRRIILHLRVGFRAH